MLISEIVLGIAFSNQVRSRVARVVLKLIVRYFAGRRRCSVSVKKPREVENMFCGVWKLVFRLRVKLLSSKAIENPRIVIIIAAVFRYQGIVMTCTVVIGIL